MLEYIIKNPISLNNEIYFTIIMSQIAILGILLTFSQFVASFRGEKDSVRQYLGRSVPQYYLNHKISMYKIVLSKIFITLFFLEILYKPLCFIFVNFISVELLSCLNLFWYSFAIIYLVIFGILFFQCATSVLKLNHVMNLNKYNRVLSNIDKSILNKSPISKFKFKSIDLLLEDVDELIFLIGEDNNKLLNDRYINLFSKLLEKYVEEKNREICLLLDKGKMNKNQIAWVYNSECEIQVLKKILSHTDMLQGKLMKCIINSTIDLVENNIKRASHREKCIDNDKYASNNDYNTYIKKNWIEFTLKIYNVADIENQIYLIHRLFTHKQEDGNDFDEYKKECFCSILKNEAIKLSKNEMLEEDFKNIFGDSLIYEANNMYLSKLLINIILDNYVSLELLVKLLSDKNRKLVFMYVIVYYSICKFREDWKYIDVELLKMLYNSEYSLNTDDEYIINFIEKSNISNRFNKKIYNEIVDLLHTGLYKLMSNKTLDIDYRSNLFYILVVRMYVFEDSIACYYDMNMSNQFYFYWIMEVAKHEELLKTTQIQEFNLIARYSCFSQISKYEQVVQPENIRIRHLILMNIEPLIFLNNKYYLALNTTAAGGYALLKLNKNSKYNEAANETIKSAYITFNASIEDYIKYLEEEMNKCGFSIHYIQKEKMKQYLINII